jgi:hypothetical protein
MKNDLLLTQLSLGSVLRTSAICSGLRVQPYIVVARGKDNATSRLCVRSIKSTRIVRIMGVAV